VRIARVDAPPASAGVGTSRRRLSAAKPSIAAKNRNLAMSNGP